MNANIHEQVAAYALDALDAAEEGSFREHLDDCPVCRVDLAGLHEVAGALALDVAARSPAPALRDRLLAAVGESRPPAVVTTLRRRWAPRAAGALTAVAAAAVIALAIWGVSIQRSLAGERSARRGDAQALAVLADPTARRFPLVGARGSVVVTSTRRAALVVTGLRRAPSGMTYELWIVRGGEPVPAGLFPGGGEQTLVALDRFVPAASRVAVSLEQRDGSPRPTRLLFGAQTV